MRCLSKCFFCVVLIICYVNLLLSAFEPGVDTLEIIDDTAHVLELLLEVSKEDSSPFIKDLPSSRKTIINILKPSHGYKC